jgi:c-di-GMP-binding flagellar brake protein YcgR
VTVGWWGKCRVGGDKESNWIRCDVLDISVIGVGLELFGEMPEEVVEHRLVVQVQPPVGSSVTLRLEGQAKDMSPGLNGGTRVGMEFVDISEVEQQVLQVMELLQEVW